MRNPSRGSVTKLIKNSLPYFSRDAVCKPQLLVFLCLRQELALSTLKPHKAGIVPVGIISLGLCMFMQHLNLSSNVKESFITARFFDLIAESLQNF